MTLTTGLTEQKYLPRPAGHRAGAVAAVPTSAAHETGCWPRPPAATRSSPLPSQSGCTGDLPHVLPQGRDETRKQGAAPSSVSAFQSEPCSPCPVVQTQNFISLSQDQFPRPVLLLLVAGCGGGAVASWFRLPSATSRLTQTGGPSGFLPLRPAASARENLHLVFGPHPKTPSLLLWLLLSAVQSERTCFLPPGTHHSAQGAASQHAQLFPSTRGHRLLQVPPFCPACPGRSQAANARPGLQTFLPSAGGKATAPCPALRMHSPSCAHQAVALGMSKEALGVQEILCFLEDVAPGLNFGS